MIDILPFGVSMSNNVSDKEVNEFERKAEHEFLKKNFDIVALEKVGFFKDITDLDSCVRRVCSFFKLDTIFDYNSIGRDFKGIS